MLFRCFCVLSGAYSLGLCHSLPADDLLLPAVLFAAIGFCRRRCRALAWFTAGFTVMWIAAWIVIEDRLDPDMQGETIAIDARIAAFPDVSKDLLRLVVIQDRRPDLPRRMRLSWYRPDVMPLPGELWHLRVRLRLPHGYSNPDGFDYEGFLFRERIGATGYVVSHKDNRKLSAMPVGRISRFRRDFVDRVTRLLPADDAAAVLLAVGVGARHRISREQWDRYAITGTSHLMAISGLHVGLAAGGVMTLAWAILALCFPRANVRDVALLTAVLAAGIYVSLSGFAVPARRAFLMALLAAVAVLLRRKADGPTLLAVPCLVLFFTDPISIHAPGFKLSFAAVAILLWCMQHFERRPALHGSSTLAIVCSNLRRLGTLQVALLIGLFPLTVLIFGRFSAVAPLMNLLVLPVFNFVTVPFCLIGMIIAGPMQTFGDQLLIVAHHSIRLVLAMVSVAADLPGVRSDIYPLSGVVYGILFLSGIHVVLPPGWPGRRLAWLALAAVVAHRPAAPPDGCLDYHVLDVGQGLATVLRAGEHTILFDTGPSFRRGSSTAELVIIPFLKSRGIDRLQTLIVSHADQDHAGGALAIANQFVIDRMLVGEFVAGVDLEQTPCGSASSWRVDGVEFQFLHPAGEHSWQGNNASCVLQIITGRHKLLLTGDIESPVEARLVKNLLVDRVDAVVVPHHGSRTSSSQAFVTALRPSLAIVSAGFGNRWGFPKTDVVQRWENTGARLLDTATLGAISQRICQDSGAQPLQLERRDSRKYWH